MSLPLTCPGESSTTLPSIVMSLFHVQVRDYVVSALTLLVVTVSPPRSSQLECPQAILACWRLARRQSVTDPDFAVDGRS